MLSFALSSLSTPPLLLYSLWWRSPCIKAAWEGKGLGVSQNQLLGKHEAQVAQNTPEQYLRCSPVCEETTWPQRRNMLSPECPTEHLSCRPIYERSAQPLGFRGRDRTIRPGSECRLGEEPGLRSGLLPSPRRVRLGRQ